MQNFTNEQLFSLVEGILNIEALMLHPLLATMQSLNDAEKLEVHDNHSYCTMIWLMPRNSKEASEYSN